MSLTVNYPPAGGSSAGVRTTAGSNVSSLTISNLNGNVDGDYEISGTLLLPAAAVFNSITIQPNADAANATGEQSQQTAAGTMSGLGLTTLLIAAPNTTGVSVTLSFLARLHSAANDGNRNFQSFAFYTDSVGRSNSLVTGQYTQTTNNITSIVVSSNQASSILTGSFIIVRTLGITA